MHPEYLAIYAIMEDRIRVAESRRRIRAARTGRPPRSARRAKPVRRRVPSLKAGGAA